jgi:hypothetical protein
MMASRKESRIDGEKIHLRQNVGTRRRSRRLAPGVLFLCLVMVFASALTMVSSPAKAGGYGGPIVPSGDYVSFTCSHGAVYLNAALVCHDQSGTIVLVCGTGYCSYTLTATADPPYLFGSWGSSGDSCLGNYPSCGHSSTINPSPYWGQCTGRCSGSLVLNTQGYVWIPPYGSGSPWSSTSCPPWPLPCGTNTIHANTENTATGYVSNAVESLAGILSSGGADGWVEFVQYIGSPSQTGTWTIDFGWDISWSLWVSAVCFPPAGGSYAAGSVTLGGNGYDQKGYPLHNGDVTNTLLSSATSCPGIPWGGGGSGGVAKLYDVTFSAYLVTSDTYTFYTWVHVSTTAAGDGFGAADAQAYVTYGTGTSSYSWWMSYE